jgi:hypothetical protein
MAEHLTARNASVVQFVVCCGEGVMLAEERKETAPISRTNLPLPAGSQKKGNKK